MCRYALVACSVICFTFCGVSLLTMAAISVDRLIWHNMCNTACNNFDLLLHKDFPYPPSAPNSSTRPCSTTRPNKSTERSAIQKGSVQCTVVATDVSRLLSTLWSNEPHTRSELFSFVPLSGRYTTTLSILELITKPDSLLLEDRRSKTSTEGRNYTNTLLFIALALVHYAIADLIKKNRLNFPQSCISCVLVPYWNNGSKKMPFL